MNEEVDALLVRAGRELEAARLLAGRGFRPQAISRSYYAAFYAAEAALLALGEARAKHSGVISAFAELVVRKAGLDPEQGTVLRSLFTRRNEADYSSPPDSAKAADEAVHDAERFVESVRSWLADLGPVGS